MKENIRQEIDKLKKQALERSIMEVVIVPEDGIATLVEQREKEARKEVTQYVWLCGACKKNLEERIAELNQ